MVAALLPIKLIDFPLGIIQMQNRPGKCCNFNTATNFIISMISKVATPKAFPHIAPRLQQLKWLAPRSQHFMTKIIMLRCHIVKNLLSWIKLHHNHVFWYFSSFWKFRVRNRKHTTFKSKYYYTIESYALYIEYCDFFLDQE